MNGYPIKDYLNGWSKSIINSVLEFYDKLESYFGSGIPPEEELDFKITIDSPGNADEFVKRTEYYQSILPDILDEL